MPTRARVRRDDVPMHFHPTSSNAVGRWHGPWERHSDNSHVLQEAFRPTWEITRHWLSPERREARDLRYADALAGAQLINWSQRRTLVSVANVLDEQVTDSVLGIALDNRTFGVEIECNTNIYTLVSAFAEHGLRIVNETYNHDNRPWWKMVPDGSIHNSNRNAGFSAIEIVSPILRGVAGLTELENACKAMASIRTTVNSSCGLHVHHDAGDLTLPAVKTLANNWAKAQPAIDMLVAPSRREGRWCRSFTSYELGYINQANDLEQACRQERYKALNLAAYFVHRTVEVRQHQGTTDFKKIASWILLGQRFMDKAVKGEVLSEDAGHLGNLLTELALPEQVVSFFQRRAEEFIGQSSRTTLTRRRNPW